MADLDLLLHGIYESQLVGELRALVSHGEIVHGVSRDPGGSKDS
jgi:hypothetical protein